MREGWNSNLFTVPFKPGIPVFLLHACFSTGWVENFQVSNPIETIYNFAQMFNGAGANYYATAWNGAEIIYDFLNGASNFQDANNQNYEKIVTSTFYNGVQVWRNNNGYAAFVGDWNGKFPSVSQTTAYDESTADAWYHSDRQIFNNHYVVWTDTRDGTTHIYYKNLVTGVCSRVSWVDSEQTFPTISGNIVVWIDNRDGGSHIYYKNLETGEGSRVSWVNSNQANPSIFGSTVVWTDTRDGTTHIYYKNLETKAGSRVSWIDSTQTNPAISGNTVVWTDTRDGGNHIYYKNLETGEGSRVSWVDSNQINPSIS